MVIFSLKKIGVDLDLDISKDETDLIEKNLPVELIDGSIVDIRRQKRCILEFKNRTIIGGYGILQELYRIDEKGRVSCYVKYSKEKSLNILNEALLQYISYTTLKKYKIQYMISKVYDIYKRNDTIFFTMEKIDGVSVLQYILDSDTPERVFIDTLVQLCIVLLILKKEIYLDHRDLRYTNLFIVKEKRDIHLEFYSKSEKKEYRLSTPFHICLLDFGFACVGKQETVINASEDIFQKKEICLKPGRDMFQIIASLFCLKEFRNKLDPNFLKIVETWFIYNDTDYSNLAKSSSEWTYILTSEESFNSPFFVPENFLNYLYGLKKEYV
jgi:serine/threonine protein kinase